MNKKLTIFFLSISSFVATAQVPCEFNTYNRKGGLYYFATYYDGYGTNRTMEGVCEQRVSQTNAPYAYRNFKNGILQDEVLYNIESQKPYSEFHRMQKDSVIALLEIHNELNELTARNTYYLNKDGRRCWKQETFQRNKLTNVQFYRSLHTSELATEPSAPPRPDHMIDSEGYTDVHVQFGPEIGYHTNGKISYIKHYKLIITDSPYYYDMQEGKYQSFSESGQLLEEGNYHDGKKAGTFHYYYPNGNKNAIRSYDNDVPVGNWKSWYIDGTIESTENYGDKYYWPTGSVKRYDNKGHLYYEKEVLANGKGFERTYYDDGKLKERKQYEYGPNDVYEHHLYYPSGRVQSRSYLHDHKDTVGVSYFESGEIQKLNMYEVETDGTYTQRIWEYFLPNKPSLISVTTHQPAGKTTQLIERYNSREKLIHRMETHNQETVETTYWDNGKLKRSTMRINNLLEKELIEKDSLGALTFECSYHQGIRIGKCKLAPQPFAYTVSKSDIKAISMELIKWRYNEFYSGDGQNRLTAQALNQQAEAAAKVIAYAKSNGFDFPFDTNEKYVEPFQYHAEIPLVTYQNNKSKIDSVIKVMSLQIESQSESHGMLQLDLSSKSMLYLIDFNHHFRGILPENAGYFNPNYGNMRIEIDFGGYKNRNYQSLQVEELTNAFKVTVSTAQGTKIFVLYPDNSIEFYNGIGDWNTTAYPDIQHIQWD